MQNNKLFSRSLPLRYFAIGLIMGAFIGIYVIIPLTGNELNLFPTTPSRIGIVGTHDEPNHDVYINNTLAQKLYDEVKVLCWILTGPKNHEKKAKHVKATWGKRCNYLLFMSSEHDDSLPAIALDEVEDRDHLWGKTKKAFTYVYQNYFDKADWFFKADDDTFAVMENMRYMLHFHNTSDPVYFGYRFKPFVNQGYMSGGAGYVLSREALKRFVEQSLPDPAKCLQDNVGNEDLEMGKCMEAVGVVPGDSRDNKGRSTFLPARPRELLVPGVADKDFWMWWYVYYHQDTGFQCCSDNIITMHYISPDEMYLLEYFIYHVKPFGLSYNPEFKDGVFGNGTTQLNETLT